jgi:hypothetical protein
VVAPAAAVDGAAARAVPVEGAPAAPDRTQPTYAVVEEPILAEPLLALVEAAPADETVAVAAPRLWLSLLVPGQVRSPIATGGIPVLAPGPSEPVRVVDLRTATRRPGADDETQPLPVITAQLTDALVYAAIAEAEAAALTRTLELPDAGGRHAGPLHTGDAHHAGDYARELVPVGAGGGGTATLYVVRRGKHVA